LLRESSKATGENYDLTVLTDGAGDGNIRHGALLVAFADAVLGGDDKRLSAIRCEIRTTMGDAALVDAAAIAATFNAIDRVADSTGIQIEDAKAEATVDLRSALGLDAFAENRGEVADPRERT
jgi:phosphoribosylaminoimidazole-succinocarboxamide synthase